MNPKRLIVFGALVCSLFLTGANAPTNVKKQNQKLTVEEMGLVPNLKIRPGVKVDYICIHHTEVNTPYNQLHATNNYHKEKWGSKSSLGWYGGYNGFIDKLPTEQNGLFTQFRVIGEDTLAQKHYNWTDKEDDHDGVVSVCLTGDFNKKYPTQLQMKTLKAFVARVRVFFPNAKITFHRELQTKRDCPGKNLTRAYLKSFGIE